jgi:hypothetical protein
MVSSLDCDSDYFVVQPVSLLVAERSVRWRTLRITFPFNLHCRGSTMKPSRPTVPIRRGRVPASKYHVVRLGACAAAVGCDAAQTESGNENAPNNGANPGQSRHQVVQPVYRASRVSMSRFSLMPGVTLFVVTLHWPKRHAQKCRMALFSQAGRPPRAQRTERSAPLTTRIAAAQPGALFWWNAASCHVGQPGSSWWSRSYCLRPGCRPPAP